MAITDKNTLLIIGAGASVPFSMPNGGNLLSRISSSLAEEFRLIRGTRQIDPRYNYRKIRDAVEYSAKFFSSPHIGALASLSINDRGEANDAQISTVLDEAQNFKSQLESQTSETIDDFIALNPKLSEIAKTCIAVEFAKSLYHLSYRPDRKSPYEKPELKPIANRHVGPNYPEKSIESRNWIHLLINIIRAGVGRKKVTRSNKVQIITFNYDMILEYVLDNQFSNVGANERFLDWRDYIDVVHPHGKCGDLKEKLGSPAKTMTEWAQGIAVVNEPLHNIPEDIKKDRLTAQKWIAEAKEIYACGFSFSGPNCDLLGMRAGENLGFDRLISYCNYDGNPGLTNIVKSYEHEEIIRPASSGAGTIDGGKFTPTQYFKTTVMEAAGAKGHEKGISEWFLQGFPGAMPG